MLLDHPLHHDEDCNPIDSLETVMSDYNWVFDRPNEEELFVKLHGAKNDYNLFFAWDEAHKVLQICCQYDLKVSAQNLQAARDMLPQINEKSFLGHFHIPDSTHKPSFRYSALMKGLGADQARGIVNEVVDLSLSQCERVSEAFAMLCADATQSAAHMDLALMDVQGQS